MDDQSPATKADLQRLKQTMNEKFGAVHENFEKVDVRFEEMHQKFEKVDERFGEMHTRFEEVHQRFDRSHEDIDRVLDVLVHVDKRQKDDHKDHEKRISRLEKAIAA